MTDSQQFTIKGRLVIIIANMIITLYWHL